MGHRFIIFRRVTLEDVGIDCVEMIECLQTSFEHFHEVVQVKFSDDLNLIGIIFPEHVHFPLSAIVDEVLRLYPRANSSEVRIDFLGQADFEELFM